MADELRGWGVLPDAVVRDERLSDTALVVLAFRATFVGPYGLNEKYLGRISRADSRGQTGLGKNSARQVISKLVELGLLSRSQPKAREGTYAYASDRLTLPDVGQDGRRVYRLWFNGTWSVEELAAYLVLRAGLLVKGRDGAPICLQWLSADDLRKRFDWSREKTALALQGLKTLGRIEQEDRREQGAFRGTRYRAAPWPAASAGDGDSGQRLAGRREDERHTYDVNVYAKRGTHIESVSGSLPSEDSIHKTLSTPSQDEGAFMSLEQLEEHCFADDHLLGWITDLESSTGPEYSPVRATLEEFSQAAFETILRAVDLDNLGVRVSEAARGRVAPKLRGRVGAYCVAHIASFLVEHEEEPEEALNRVLRAIQISIGRRQQHWLNSYRLIGIRVLS